MVDRNPYEAKRLLRGPPHYSLGAAHPFGRLPNRKSCDRSLAGNKISGHSLYADMQEDERFYTHHSLQYMHLRYDFLGGSRAGNRDFRLPTSSPQRRAGNG